MFASRWKIFAISKVASRWKLLACILLLIAASVFCLGTLLWNTSHLRKDRTSQTHCLSPWRLRLREHLHGVVLVVNNNFDDLAKNTTIFLRTLYAPLFGKIIFLSPSGCPELGIQARTESDPFGKKWFGAYTALQWIVNDNPEAKGFLWMGDDVAVNYWKLIRGSTTKIWVRRYDGRNFPFDTRAPTNFSNDWPAYADRRREAWHAYQNMSLAHRAQFERSMLPSKGLFPKRVIDLLYLPRSIAVPLANELIPIFRRFSVWSELALPMMLFSLQNPSEYDDVLDDMEYRWEHYGFGTKKAYDPKQYWSSNISALHPWKLSKQKSREEYIRSLGAIDPCLLSINAASVYSS